MTCRCGSALREGEGHCPSCGVARPTAWLARTLARLIAWTVAAFVLHALFAGGWLVRGSSAAFLFVFGRSAGSVAESFMAVTVVVGMYALLAECAVGDRVPVFKPFARAVGRVLAVLPKAALWVARATFLLVEGKPPPALDKKGGKKPGDKG